MRAVIQRCLLPAQVKVNDLVKGRINKGLIVYLGVETADNEEDINWLSRKIVNLRIFNDDAGKMNLSVKDLNGSILLISQFTLYASTKKGNRPSFIRSADPKIAESQYERMRACLNEEYMVPTETGVFGADMKVEYINDGPVTIIIDSKNRE